MTKTLHLEDLPIKILSCDAEFICVLERMEGDKPGRQARGQAVAR